MAEVRAEFNLDVKSDASSVAQSSAASLEQMRNELVSDISELRNMQKALRDLKAGGDETRDAAAALQERIEAGRVAVANSQAAYVRAGGTFKKLAPQAQQARRSLGDLTDAAAAAPGPLGRLAGSVGGLGRVFAGTAGAIGGVVIGLGALVAATTAAAGVLSAYGIAQADARRSERLRLEGLTKIRRFMSGGGLAFGEVGGDAGELQKTIDRVSGSVALGRDKLVGYATELKKLGLRGGNFQQALEGMAITAATQGEAEAQRFKSLALSAGLTGQSIEALADDVRARLGGIARRQLLSLDVQMQKMRENIGLLFQDLKIEPLLAGIKEVTDLFSQSEATGRGLKTILDSLLDPLINGIGEAGPIAKRFFQGMVIAGLQLSNTILRLRIWFKRTFGSDLLKDLDLTEAALLAGETAGWALAAAFGGVAIAAGAATAPLALLAGSATLVHREFNKLRDVINFDEDLALLTEAFAVTWAEILTGLPIKDFVQGGKDLVLGIARGIRDAFVEVKNAVTDLGGSAVQWFKGKIGAASPAKAFIPTGLSIGQGVEVGTMRSRRHVRTGVQALGRAAVGAGVGVGAGVRRSFGLGVRGVRQPPTQLAQRRAQVQRATAPRFSVRVSSATQQPAPQPQRRAALARGGNVTVNIEALHVGSDAVGEGGPEAFASAVRDELVRALEGSAITLGASTPGVEAA